MAWLGCIRTGSTSTALVSSGLSESLKVQAERAIASVVEAECPLCKVELRVHDDRACLSVLRRQLQSWSEPPRDQAMLGARAALRALGGCLERPKGRLAPRAKRLT